MIERIQNWFQDRRIRKITLAGAMKRVLRGATYLDDVDPGWHRRIDVDTLELRSGSSCVLGQLHGDFRLGLRRAHLFHCSSAPRSNLSPVSYGFFSMQDVPSSFRDRDFHYLNEAWSIAIRKRQRRDELGAAGDGAAEEPSSRERMLY